MVPGELLESDQLSDVCCFLLASLEMLGCLSQQETGELRRAGSQWMETRVGLLIRPVIRNVNNQNVTLVSGFCDLGLLYIAKNMHLFFTTQVSVRPS